MQLLGWRGGCVDWAQIASFFRVEKPVEELYFDIHQNIEAIETMSMYIRTCVRVEKPAEELYFDIHQNLEAIETMSMYIRTCVRKAQNNNRNMAVVKKIIINNPIKL